MKITLKLKDINFKFAGCNYLQTVLSCKNYVLLVQLLLNFLVNNKYIILKIISRKRYVDSYKYLITCTKKNYITFKLNVLFYIIMQFIRWTVFI